jgi:putative ABC transport system permease protein
MRPFVQAARALRRRPAFTLTLVLTLGLGIGVTTAAFSLVDGVLIRPLPFPDAGQLVTVYEANPSQRERVSLVAPVRIEDWNRLNQTFTAVSGHYFENVTDTSGAEPERLAGVRVMPRYFDVFQMKPLLGRTFRPDEERYGGPTAAVISEGFWTRRFNRAPTAVGLRLIVRGVGYTIVGVMPAAFTTYAADVWIPAQLSSYMLQMRDARFISGVARMKPGITLVKARADLLRVQAALGDQYPKTDKGWGVELRDLKDARVGTQRSPLFFVFGAVALLLLIALANVAGLMLVQLRRRAAELAIRAAIGASRPRVVAAVMWEVGLVTLAAAAAGTALSYWLTKVLILAFPGVPRIGEVAFDARALVFVAGAAAGAAVVCGILPALYATRAKGVAPLLSSASRGVAGGHHALQSLLVAGQIALGIALAAGAGLLVRSYNALTSVHQGFSAANVLTFHVGAAWDEDRTRISQMQDTLLAALQDMPGVRAAGFTNFLPATGATLRYQVFMQGLAGTDQNGGITVGERTITAGYLQAIGVPLVGGAWCETPRAGQTSQPTAMVNQRFVEEAAGGTNVVGRTFRFLFGGDEMRVVGVVGNVLEDGPSAPAVPYVYACLRTGAWPDPEYVVRTAGDPRLMAASLRQLVHTIDASRPVFGMKPLDDVVGAALDEPRMNAMLLTTFAGSAIALAGLGLYAMLTLLVAEQRRELGVRLALGASASDLVRVVIATAGRPVGAGALAGVLLAIEGARLARSLLFGVTPYDPTSLAGALLLLAIAAAAALVIPARQASRVSAREMLT